MAKRSDTSTTDKNAAISETEEAFRRKDPGLILKAWQILVRIFGDQEAKDLVNILTEGKKGSKEKR
jgi:hypothetical protein